MVLRPWYCALVPQSQESSPVEVQQAATIAKRKDEQRAARERLRAERNSPEKEEARAAKRKAFEDRRVAMEALGVELKARHDAAIVKARARRAKADAKTEALLASLHPTVERGLPHGGEKVNGRP
jgi:hypothetical protein